MPPEGRRHFTKQGLARAIGEVRSRHVKGYEALASDLIGQIRTYHGRISGENPKLLIGLSGGIDSAVVTCLAARAVGVENIVPLTLPARKADDSVHLSARVRESLGMQDRGVPHAIDITDVVAREIAAVNRPGHEAVAIEEDPAKQTAMDRMRIGNFASRARVAMLYDIGRKVNGKVLGTGNRTEFVQGYAAKWGTPMAFDFGVLDELYKTDVYELAGILQVPKEVVKQEPSTGYFPGQTHERELGATLEEQDAGAYLLFERRMDPGEIVTGYGASRDYLETLLQRYDGADHKRILRQPHASVNGRKQIVYFAGAIRGDRALAEFMRVIVDFVKGLGIPVLTEHVAAEKPTAAFAEKVAGKTMADLTAEEIERRHARWLEEATHLVAEISGGSTGTGREIEYCTRRGIKVLCLHREDREFFASPMIRGMTPDRYPNVSIRVYRDVGEVKRIIETFLQF